MRSIGIYLFPGVEELDAMGPWEVLAFWTREFPEDGWQTELIADTLEPVTAAKGAVLTPHALISDELDVLVVPGGQGTRRLIQVAPTLDWLNRLHDRGALVTSVCTGALLLAAAGLLRDRPATTYHASFPDLLAIDPTITPRPEDRWVDDGDVVTGAGVSAGIDMALHLVRRLAGAERALSVRRGIQYDPEPPV